MTLPNETIRNDYVGNGATVTYPYSFKLFTTSSIRVLVDGVEQTYPTAYTLTGVGSDSLGNVVFTTAPASNATITFLGDEPLTQTTDLANETRFYQDRIEDRFDRIVRTQQIGNEKIGRQLSLPEDEVGSAAATTIPSVDERANKVAAYDSLGRPTVAGGITDAPDSAYVIADGSTTARDLSERFADVVNVKDFGAVGDGVTDDTDAIQAAIDHALTGYTYPYRPVVFFPTGVYLTDTLSGDSGNIPLLVGTDMLHTRIQHVSGSAAPLFTVPDAGGGSSTPSGGFLNLSLLAGDSTTALAYFAGDVDCGLKFHNVQFVGWATSPGTACDAISVRDYVNLHIERVRFDYIGGWAVNVRGPLTYGLTPLTLRDFTYDNGTVAFSNGRGVIKIDASGLNAYKGTVSVSNARIELNTTLNSPETVKSLFRVNAHAFVDTGYSQIDWDFRCIVADVTATARSIAFLVSSLRDPSAHFIDCRTNVYSLADNDTNSMQRREGLNAGGVSGLINGTIQGLRFDGPSTSRHDRVSGLRHFRASSDSNLTGQGALFERGDRALCSAPNNAGGTFQGHRPWGFLAIHTADGLVRGSSGNLTGTGTISLGTPTTLTMSTAPGSAAVPGTRISIPGAGPAAATLSTRIVARNDTTNVLTIADAASTAVSGVTVAVEVGQWLGVNAVLMSDSVPASGTWAVGDEVRRGSVTALAPVTGYRCTVAGTPGTWRQIGHIVSKAATGSRPTLTASDVGVLFLDTTLDADGKPIWWTGTAWVDATGATV